MGVLPGPLLQHNAVLELPPFAGLVDVVGAIEPHGFRYGAGAHGVHGQSVLLGEELGEGAFACSGSPGERHTKVGHATVYTGFYLWLERNMDNIKQRVYHRFVREAARPKFDDQRKMLLDGLKGK